MSPELPLGSHFRDHRPQLTCNSFFCATLLLSVDPASIARDQTGPEIALSRWAGNVLLDWIPVNSRSCEFRFHGSAIVNRCQLKRRSLFVVSVYELVDSSSLEEQDDF